MTAVEPSHPAAWYRLVLDSVAELVVVVDASGRLVWANRTAELVLGYVMAEEVGRNVIEWVHPDDLEEAARLLAVSLESGYSWPMELRVRHADGSYLTLQGGDMDALSEAREHFVITFRRVQSPRVATVGEAHLSPLFVVLHHVSDAIIAVGAEGQVVFRNRSASELLRVGAARVTSPLPAGVVLAPFGGSDGTEATREWPFDLVRHGRKVPRHEARLTFADGVERVVEVTGEPLTDSHGEPAGGVVALRDVTELRHQEAELRELALRDPLTGLANRTELMAHLRAMLADRLLHGGQVVVMFVDLDRFKDINDTFDHLVGDEVLQVTARRLVECVGPTGLVARFGGEEFVVVSTLDAAEADALARRVVERVREPMLTAAGTTSTSCSVGLAVGTGAAEPEQLLREADTAVYAAKRMGGATVAWYDRSQRERAVHRVRATLNAQVMSEGVGLLRWRPVVELESGRTLAVRAEVPDVERAVLSAQSALDRRLILAFVQHAAEVDRRLRETIGPAAPLVMMPIPTQVLSQRALLDELGAELDAAKLPEDRRLIDVVTVEHTAAVEASVLADYVHVVGCRLVLDDARALLSSVLLELDLAVWAVRAPRELVWRLPSARAADRHAGRALAEAAAAHRAPLAADRIDTEDQLKAAVDLGAALGWGEAVLPVVTLDELAVPPSP